MAVIIEHATDESAGSIRQAEQMLQNDRCRRLAICAGDADQFQRSGWLAVKAMGKDARERFGILAFDGGTTCPGTPFGITENAGGAGIFGRPDEVASIDVFTGAGQKDHAWPTVSRVFDEIIDGAGRFDTMCRDIQLIKKFVQGLHRQSVASDFEASCLTGDPL